MKFGQLYLSFALAIYTIHILFTLCDLFDTISQNESSKRTFMDN